ncbi:unnamed protein product, partial [Staurois parvus]
QWCAVSLGHRGSTGRAKDLCVQSQLIADHQGTDDQCALMICVDPEVPPVSVHQCQLSVLIHATCQCPSVPHQCHTSVPTSAHQCLPVHINATYQCSSELPFSVTYQCQSVPPSSASQCYLSVLPIS